MDEKELAQQVLDRVQVIPTKYKIAGACLVVLLIVAIVTATILYFKHGESVEEKNQQAKVMSQQYSTDVNALQNQLAQSKQNAELLAEFIKKAQAGQVQPITNFTVQATSPTAAARQVAERINANDPLLPPAALEKTDRTVVTSVAATAEQKAAIDKQNAKDGTNINDTYLTQVYKENTYKDWYVGSGVGVHEGKAYIPVAAQRNYSKDSAVEVQVNIDPQKQSANGGQIMYKRATNKLFGIF